MGCPSCDSMKGRLSPGGCAYMLRYSALTGRRVINCRVQRQPLSNVSPCPMQLCRAVSQANVTAANLRSVEQVASQVASLGQRMLQLQSSLDELNHKVEQLSLNGVRAHR